MWFRVFGSNESEPSPELLAAILRSDGPEPKLMVRADDQGWFRLEIELEANGGPLHFDRYLAKEKGIRSELNAWAAWAETQEGHPNRERLMLQVIGTAQLFTLCLGERPGLDQRRKGSCVKACQHLARESSGVYQVDGLGFFDPQGSCLLEEPAEPIG